MWVRLWLARVLKNAVPPSTGTASRPPAAARSIPGRARMSAWLMPPAAAHRGCLRRGPSPRLVRLGRFSPAPVSGASAPAPADLPVVIDYRGCVDGVQRSPVWVQPILPSDLS